MQTPISLFTPGNEKAHEMLADAAITSTNLDANVESVQAIESAQIVESVRQEEIAVVNVSSPASKTLDELSQDASDCRLCALADTRNKVVFGVGNVHAALVFIGEAPGREEDIKGEPFVGRAGQLLDRMLDAIELDRQKIYILTIIKCRPPNNRDPKPDEVQSCNVWFEQQMKILQPKLICLLGSVAAQTVLKTDATLNALRERWHDYNGIPAWVTYHPSSLLRSPQQKKKSWQDMTMLSHKLRELG